MKIALVSLNQVWEDKEVNLSLCEDYIKEASMQKVDLIIFPEMTLTGFSTNIEKISEVESSSKTIIEFQRLSKKYNIAILFGVVIKDENKALNRSVFVDNNGNILGIYTKIHPFTFTEEDKYFNAGNKLSVVEYQGIKIALTICYDLRFPELYSASSKQSDMVVNIANWPKKRVEHWNTLLKARAIENQTFVIGVNRIGTDGNSLEYKESSNIYNANGDRLACGSFQDMKIYDVDSKFTQEFRSKFNTINDRKPKIYKEII